jgi:hypothetical protein
MTTADSSPTLMHAIGLLAEPAFGAAVVALLHPDDRLRAGANNNGFVMVETEAGVQGFVPGVICAHGTARYTNEPPTIRVIQATTLYRSPTPGDQYGARWLVHPSEALQVLESVGMFRKIQRPNGQIGYVPAALCRLSYAPRGGPAVYRLVQTVALYSSPTPGGQYESRWQIDPSERLLELGRDERFVLIQRENGEMGYLPIALCGEMIADTILPIGSIDLGWIAVGGGWGIVNWAGLAVSLYRLVIIDTMLKPYIGLAIVLGVAAALWFSGRKRLVARSFAIGVLLAYALLHINSGGLFTLWIHR